MFDNPFALSLAQIFQKPFRLLIAAIVLLVLAVHSSVFEGGTLVHEVIEWIGMMLIFICVFGRTWCSLYIGGRKITELVKVGPYSISRNPLYVFSALGTVGVGAQLGSITDMVLAGSVGWLVLHAVVMREERMLDAIHGTEFRDYCVRVPRYWPRMSQWQGPDVIQIRMSLVVQTFFDACIFLLAVPVAESLEYLQSAGILPVLFRLP